MEWLESTALAEWVRVSLVGYPFVLTAHSVGMAIMVGLVAVVDLRLMGLFKRIPYTALDDLVRVAWYGFIINVLSGAALFTSQAVAYSTSPIYLFKMLMVLCGAITVAYIQPQLRRHAASWVGGAALPQSIKIVAIASLSMWMLAVIAGRFTAYL